jgi:hypothetical protein
MAENPIRHAGEEPVTPDLAPRLLRLVRDLADELHPGAELAKHLGLDHSLERDYFQPTAKKRASGLSENAFFLKLAVLLHQVSGSSPAHETDTC